MRTFWTLVVLSLYLAACSGSESSESSDSSQSDSADSSKEIANPSALTSAEECADLDPWDLPDFQCTGEFTCTVESEDCYCAAPFEGPVACTYMESKCSCSEGAMTCDQDPAPPFDWRTECVEPRTETCDADHPCAVGVCFSGRCHSHVPIGEDCDEDFEWLPCGGDPFYCTGNLCTAPCTTNEDCAAYEGVEALGNVPADTYTCETKMGRCVLAPKPSVHVAPCADFYAHLDAAAINALTNAGLTQCSMPFGVLLAADAAMPESHITLAAQILAEMIDQDMNDEADDPNLVDAVKRHDVAWLAMPTDLDKWEGEQWPLLNASPSLGYDIIIPSWWLDIEGETLTEHARRVMVEEITHFLTQFGYAAVYPDQFAVNNWASVIAKETKDAQCLFWQHPENSCPESPGDPSGDCSDPSCDVVEFYHQVLITRAGMTPAWLGIGFPDNAETLEGLLSDKIKAVMDDPKYHQLKAPLSFAYPVVD